ncbi:MAG UNVERIFIED_CONTAM: hypothetical protein LVT10_26585 [Anaerolineae bacterium]
MVEAGVYYVVALAFNLPIEYGVIVAMVGGVNLAGLIPLRRAWWACLNASYSWFSWRWASTMRSPSPMPSQHMW